MVGVEGGFVFCKMFIIFYFGCCGLLFQVEGVEFLFRKLINCVDDGIGSGGEVCCWCVWIVLFLFIVVLVLFLFGQSVVEGQLLFYCVGDFFLWVLFIVSSWGSWGGQFGEYWGSWGEKMGLVNKVVMGDVVMEFWSFQIFRIKLCWLVIYDLVFMDFLFFDYYYYYIIIIK